MKTTPNQDKKRNLVLYKYVKNVHCVSPIFFFIYQKLNNIIDYKII